MYNLPVDVQESTLSSLKMSATSTTVKVFAGFLAGAISGYIGRTVITNEVKLSQREAAVPDLIKYGKPESFPEVTFYKNHALHYDQARKIPLWVAEHITPDHIQGKANRKHSKFRPDPSVPEMFTANNKDYWHSGWSRGHMNPAGDNKFDQTAMDESFYLTNVLPQDIKNNGDFWNRLEIYCRDLTKTYPSVRVISGPVMVPEETSDGKRQIIHQVIGKNDVTVPTHLYKIVLVESADGTPKAMASFIVPNKDIPKSHTLVDYQVPLEQIERLSGYRFLPQLARDRVSDLCNVDGCKLLAHDQFQLYFLTRRLSNATSLERLEKEWAEIAKRNLTPDEYTANVYKEKKEQLSQKEEMR